VDIHALVSLRGIDAPTGLAAAKVIDPCFDPISSIRALEYVDGTPGRDAAGCGRVGTSSGLGKAVGIASSARIKVREGRSDEPHGSLSC
jgi:hypothetical protein